MILVVGLGNPGKQYACTRHNLGFRAADALASRWNIVMDKNKYNGLYGMGYIKEKKVIISKPQTYMNLSGQAVIPLLQWYKILPQQFIVLYDDLDLPLGKIRLRAKGGTGGHKGMLSIAEGLGNGDFPRIRMGVGRPELPEYDTAQWVLGRFSTQEELIVQKVLLTVVDAVQCIITEGIELAMNQYNRN